MTPPKPPAPAGAPDPDPAPPPLRILSDCKLCQAYLGDWLRIPHGGDIPFHIREKALHENASEIADWILRILELMQTPSDTIIFNALMNSARCQFNGEYQKNGQSTDPRDVGIISGPLTDSQKEEVELKLSREYIKNTIMMKGGIEIDALKVLLEDNGVLKKSSEIENWIGWICLKVGACVKGVHDEHCSGGRKIWKETTAAAAMCWKSHKVFTMPSRRNAFPFDPPPPPPLKIFTTNYHDDGDFDLYV